MAPQHTSPIQSVGLDFGTTNSALAIRRVDGSVELARFADNGQLTNTFRSVLYFFHPEEEEPGEYPVVAGPQAIRSYLRAEPKGRFMQSIKSFLASQTFERTRVYTRAYSLEDLIAIMLRALRAAAEAQFGDLGDAVVVGRPVHFAGATTAAEEALALSRLRTALQASGFPDVTFAFEPVAAAYAYGSQLDHAEVVLIADCGGGTSDLSLLRLSPGTTPLAPATCEVLGTDGVAMGGDVLDSQLVRHLVAPQLGWGMQYGAAEKMLPVPNWLYTQLERWDHLWFLHTPSTLSLLTTIRRTATHPERMEHFTQVITQELGYPLSKAVESTKFTLTEQETGHLLFHHPPVALSAEVTRSAFEDWIQPALHALEACVERLLAHCQITPAAVDHIFLTGGTSFVPAIRYLFARKFDAARLRRGGELTSVVRGLALCAPGS